MNKISPNAFGLACGIALTTLEILFLAFVIAFPRLAIVSISRLILVEISSITTILTWGNVILLVVATFAGGYLGGLVFAFFYNGFSFLDDKTRGTGPDAPVAGQSRPPAPPGHPAEPATKQ